MDDLYNTVLQTFTSHFENLSPRLQFHFASRMHLWNRLPDASTWLENLRPSYTAHEQPDLALKEVLQAPSVRLFHTAALRAPFLEQYPQLERTLAGMLRALFMSTIYDVDITEELLSVLDLGLLTDYSEKLLNDPAAMVGLSSMGVNFVYLTQHLLLKDDPALPIETLSQIGATGFKGSNAPSRQLRCYFYTHCIIADSLFYARAIPEQHRSDYERMLAVTEQLIDRYFDELLIDNCVEFLVCCRLLGGKSSLEERIYARCRQNVSPDGYIIDPNNTRPVTIGRAEHRNALFLMSITDPIGK